MKLLKGFMYQEVVLISAFMFRGILVGHDQDYLYLRDTSSLNLLNCRTDKDGQELAMNDWTLCPGKTETFSFRAYSKRDIRRICLASDYEWWERFKLPNPYGLDQWQKARQRKLIRERLNQEPSLMMMIMGIVATMSPGAIIKALFPTPR